MEPTADAAPPRTIELESDELRLEVDDGLALVWIDQPDAPINTIAPSTLEALEEALSIVRHDADITAAIFISGKEDTFVAGADLDALQQFEAPQDARALSEKAHALLQQVGHLRKPTVAAIHGPALGGGLELALGCSYRIATNHPATRLGLPEVNLGLIPGGGGTQYLPRLIGLQQALPIMLTGKNVYPEKARRIGLVDALIHKPGLLRAAKDAARRLAEGSLRPKREHSLTDRLLESTGLSRRLIYERARNNVQKETRGNYPAPFRLIECVRTGMEEGLEAGLSHEANAFGELAFTRESQSLVSLFFAKQEAEKNALADRARSVSRIGVLGAGLMGAGIAEVSARDGLDVIVKDQNLELAASGRKHIWQSLQRDVKKGIHSTFERDSILERVIPTDNYKSFHDVDLVIEAVPEDLDLKQAVLTETEQKTKDDCIFASNTSSIPISEIAAASSRPETVLGMHYFSPVPQIPLLEIVKTEETADWALATAYETGLRQDKTVIVVNDGPGFYTTRILALYMNEALLLLEEGASIEQVDEAMEDFGFPMGPFELFDLVGLEVGAKITEIMGHYFEEKDFAGRDFEISSAASTLVNANFLGQKNGTGFYHYEETGAGKHEKKGINDSVYTFFGGPKRVKLASETIQERLGLAMVSEAVYCLQDGILERPTDGDVGAVFGLGFPPFLGGPFRYIDRETPAAIVTRLERLDSLHGSRFRPAHLLHEMAAQKDRFYGD